MRRASLIGVMALGLVAGGAGWWALGWNAPDGAAPAASAGLSVARGKTLYAENCAVCHGANLEGQPDWRSPGPDGRLPAPPHDQTGHTWHHGDGLLFDYVSLGGREVMARQDVVFDSAMPGFGDQLSDSQINDVLAYIKSTWPDRIRTAQVESTKAEQAGNGD